MADSETVKDEHKNKHPSLDVATEETDWFLGNSKSVVTEEQAQKEVLDWLNFKNMSTRKRKDHEYSINVMVSAIMDGDLSKFDDQWVQSLRITMGTAKELKFENRKDVGTFQSVLKQQKVDGQDSDGRLTTAVSVLTGGSFSMVNTLDEEDRNLAHAIALFFL